MANKLFGNWGPEACRTLSATGTITSNRLVAADLSADPAGGSCKPIAALVDVPIGAVMEDYTVGQNVRVVYKAGSIVHLVCVDASIAVNVPVYNDVAGKVSATQGTGATLVGVTRSASAAANGLVSVELGRVA